MVQNGFAKTRPEYRLRSHFERPISGGSSESTAAGVSPTVRRSVSHTHAFERIPDTFVGYQSAQVGDKSTSARSDHIVQAVVGAFPRVREM